MAISLLLFSSQLFDGRIWRRGAPFAMAAVGPFESMMGVLMCGISVSLLFALINRLLDDKIRVQRVNPS